MASLSEYRRGLYRVQLKGGTRASLYLGKVSLETAEKSREHVAFLETCRGHQDAVPEKTLRWALALDPDDYAKLVAAGLLPARTPATAAATLGQLIDDVTAEVQSKKVTTVTYYGIITGMLLKRWTRKQALAEIGPKEADDLVTWMRAQYGPATVARRIKAVHLIFGRAQRWGWIPANPFAGIKGGNPVNHARQVYVPMADFDKVLEAEKNLEFRCVLALSRLGAFRTPSETLQLRWNDVRWEEGKLIVRSPKTEHHVGGETRTLPLFPRLKEILEVWYMEAPPGDFVISRTRDTKVNWRRRLERLILKVGLPQWPKLFHNLRASRESELVQEYPLATVCKWLGHRPEVAAKHYLMETDADGNFRRAAGMDVAQIVAQQAGESERIPVTAEVEKAQESQEMTVSEGVKEDGDWALRDSNTSANAVELEGGEASSAKCSAMGAQPQAGRGDCGGEGGEDSSFNEFAKMWPGLSAGTRAALLALARAAAGEGGGAR